MLYRVYGPVCCIFPRVRSSSVAQFSGRGSNFFIMNQRWADHETTLQLIKLYRDAPCLWDIKCANYKKRDIKALNFARIHAVIQERIPDLTPQDLKNKWHNLRSQYSEQVIKIKKSVVSGATAEEVWKPTLWILLLIWNFKVFERRKPLCKMQRFSPFSARICNYNNLYSFNT